MALNGAPLGSLLPSLTTQRLLKEKYEATFQYIAFADALWIWVGDHTLTLSNLVLSTPLRVEGQVPCSTLLTGEELLSGSSSEALSRRLSLLTGKTVFLGVNMSDAAAVAALSTDILQGVQEDLKALGILMTERGPK